MKHRVFLVLAAVLLLAIGAASLVAANVLGGQRVEQHGRVAAADRPHGDARGPDGEFHRFRLGTINGQRLEPNRDDFAARTDAQGPLLLFLPATRAKPADYQRFLGTALQDGYHVLGLDYWNLGKTLSGTCEADPYCYGAVQRNRFDGSRPSSFSSVRPSGSIVSRFRDAIGYLADHDPDGGWGRFVRGERDIAWRDIVVAGHSQGGGEAAYISHIRSVRGALMFSSPVESLGAEHAAWMDRPGRTPVDRMYAIDDVRDVFGPRIRGSWTVLGLDGEHGPFRTDTAPPGTGGDPHAILTDIRVGTPAESHSRTIKDSTPLTADGTPRMLPLWQWLLSRFSTERAAVSSGRP
ncbi:BPSS1187 family protein [Curtobacterium sp. L1-20]|uniref:BPSS1187 family protein n=1 Tax=Curtobacterium sp. L1-20 TaxID=3138181 RepID=UPI003B52F7C1